MGLLVVEFSGKIRNRQTVKRGNHSGGLGLISHLKLIRNLLESYDFRFKIQLLIYSRYLYKEKVIQF